MFKRTLTLCLVAALCVGLFAGCKSIEPTPTTPTTPEAPAVFDISSAELNFYYIDAISTQYSSWSQTFGDYTQMYLIQYYNLNISTGLDSQYYNAKTEETWADYFLDIAKKDAIETYALCNQADAKGHKLSANAQSQYDTWVKNYQDYANLYGLTADEFVAEVYGEGATYELWKEYLMRIIKAQDFSSAYGDSLTYDAAALQAYEAGREAEFSYYSYAYYHISHAKYPELGTTDESGQITFNKEQMTAALAAAKQDAESLMAATTVEELQTMMLALKCNENTQSVVPSEFTRYSYSQVQESMRSWLTDASRQPGDTTVIANTTTNDDGSQSTTGYYVVLFTERDDNRKPLANVRHLLVEFYKNTDGSYDTSKEAMAATLKIAEDLYNQWKENPTEEYFIELIKEHSDDPGSASTGGLYEDISPISSYVEGFLDWCIDPARQPGDSGIVETNYGYHIMYYSSHDEVIFRDYLIESTMANENYSKWYDSIVNNYKPVFEDAPLPNYDYVIMPNA